MIWLKPNYSISYIPYSYTLHTLYMLFPHHKCPFLLLNLTNPLLPLSLNPIHSTFLSLGSTWNSLCSSLHAATIIYVNLYHTNLHILLDLLLVYFSSFWGTWSMFYAPFYLHHLLWCLVCVWNRYINKDSCKCLGKFCWILWCISSKQEFDHQQHLASKILTN